MKRKLQIITSASAASFLAFTALAQETLNPKTDETESTRQRLTQARAERLNGAAKASDVIGMEVQNYQNEKLGKVNDLEHWLEAQAHLCTDSSHVAAFPQKLNQSNESEKMNLAKVRSLLPLGAASIHLLPPVSQG